MTEHQITLPLSDEVAESLRAGDYAFLTGPVLTARDAAHKRMMETLAKGDTLPVDIRGEVIYYVGPTPPGPGRIVGSAGPTTAVRMDPFTVPLLEAGLKGAVGKGGRGPEVAKALQEHRAVYFLAVGGAGALLARHIKAVEVVAYEDLGTEAMRRMQLDGFPVVVCNDIHGGDALALGKARWRRPG